MKAKHTPGPWYYVPDFSAIVIYRRGAASPIPVADFGKVTLPETNANARLIAAAPDLLAAAKAAASCYRTFRNVPKSEQAWTAADDEALEALFAAVAKATGGED